MSNQNLLTFFLSSVRTFDQNSKAEKEEDVDGLSSLSSAPSLVKEDFGLESKEESVRIRTAGGSRSKSPTQEESVRIRTAGGSRSKSPTPTSSRKHRRRSTSPR